MVDTAQESRIAWWRITPRYWRSRAYWVIGIVGLLQVSAFLGADSVWCLELPIHFQTQYLIAAVGGLLALGYAALRERRFGAVDRVVAAAGVGLIGYGVLLLAGLTPALRSLAPPNRPGPELARLRLISANLYSSNENHQAILDLIAAENPDLVFLMELNDAWVESLHALTERYPQRISHADNRGNFGIGFWSRLACASCELDTFGSVAYQVHAVLRLADGRRVRFLGLHPLPPISPRYRMERNRTYDTVAEMLRHEPRLPTIVAGDMNASRYAPRLQGFCRQAGLYEAGRDTVGRSWPAGPLHAFMAIRIDHVLIDDAWRVNAFRIGADVGSDHYPLIADVTLVDEK